MDKKDSGAAIVVVCILSLILLAFPAVAQESQSQALRVNGAAIASDVVQRWAASFTESHPENRVLVTGSSAGKGFETLLEGQADIALASRVISESEQKTAEGKGLKLADRPMGYAGVAVYTNPRNPLNELTLDQLAQIFTGKVDNWKQVGGPDAPIRCLSRRMPESGAVVFFWETVLNKVPFGKNTVLAENWSTIVKACAVAQDLPIGIGPVPLGENKSGAKILAIKRDENSPAIVPSPSSLKDKSYPIALLFRFYWDSQTTDKRVIPFVDYCEKMGLGKN
jgi:phosphate transport system substrate-binding protein